MPVFELNHPKEPLKIGVRAPSMADVEACAEGTGYRAAHLAADTVSGALGQHIDFTLPLDAEDLTAHLIALQPGSARVLPGPLEGSLGEYLNDPRDRWAASFMPGKCLPDNSVVKTTPEEAEFWGVYRYDLEGIATHVGDTCSRHDALALAEMVRRDVLHERRFSDVPYGIPALAG